jgi:D-threo-aldose 1-dehydrogenase
MPVPQLTPLGFGAANLGDLHSKMTEEASWEVLECAWDSGIRYFDTAPHYGLGVSERRLGRFLRTKPRDEFVLSTKVGRLLRPGGEGDDRAGGPTSSAEELVRVWDPTAAGIEASLDESLERLGLDRVDILYLHDPELYGLEHSLAEALPALTRLREDGVVRAIGVGSMSMDALIRSASTGAVDVLMVAGRYTLAEQDGVGSLREACASAGVEMVTASIFNSGLLATPTPSRSGRYNYGATPEELFDRVVRITRVCEEFGVDLPTAALQYTLRDALVRSVVVGTGRSSQLTENVTRLAAPVPEALWSELTASGFIV